MFLLLGVFAVFSTLLVLLGAQAYRAMTEASAEHNTARVMHAYVLGAVRSDDENGVIRLEAQSGVETISVYYDYGDTYVKRVYCYDGKLRESFASAESGFDPENGEVICDAQSLSAQMDGNLMTVTMTDMEGSTLTAQIALRAAR